MRIVTKLLLSAVTLLFLVCLLLPTPSFPIQPPDSVQSLEDADTETPYRRAYFTNFTREEVLKHYQSQFERSPFLGLLLPTYRLNYPPEEAFRLIRDQTRSTFLEEIVHPFRETLFVNGFKPKEAKDEIWYKGRHFEQKITVKYVPSSVFVRVPLAFLALVALFWTTREWADAGKGLLKEWFS